MAKTLTITDDVLGATASVRIEDEHGRPVVRSLHFEAAPGFGLSSEALQLMEQLGLRLPQTAPHAGPQRRPVRAPGKKAAAGKRAPAGKRARGAAASPPPAALPAPPAGPAQPADPPAGPAADPAPAAAAAEPRPATGPATGPAAAPAPAQRRPYRVGPPPGPDELREVFRRHRGVVAAMAGEYGCAPTTVASWLRKAREQGAQITLEPVDAS